MSKNPLGRRSLTFAGSTVSVEYAGARAAQIVEFLYGHVPVYATGDPHTQFHLAVEDNGRLCLSQDQVVIYQDHQCAVVAERFLGDSCYALADKSWGGALFHAGGVAWQGQGIMLPGATGAGKSTLTAWLLSQGFVYMTDELVYIPENTRTMQAFTRPLNLKRSARKVLRQMLDFDMLDFDGCSTDILSTHHLSLVPSRLFSATPPLTSALLRTIILPHYRPDSPFRWHQLSPAQAGHALMQCVINARNLTDHGFNQIINLTKTIPVYEIQYASHEQLRTKFEELQHTILAAAEV